MKCMIIAALAIVAAVQAKPQGAYGPGAQLRGQIRGPGGSGIGGGLGVRGSAGGSASGGGYGHSGYTGGSSGYGKSDYGAGTLKVGHKIAEEQSDFDQKTHSHNSRVVDNGGAALSSQGGRNVHGQNNYEAGNAGYGHRYDQGGYAGV